MNNIRTVFSYSFCYCYSNFFQFFITQLGNNPVCKLCGNFYKFLTITGFIKQSVQSLFICFQTFILALILVIVVKILWITPVCFRIKYQFIVPFTDNIMSIVQLPISTISVFFAIVGILSTTAA